MTVYVLLNGSGGETPEYATLEDAMAEHGNLAVAFIQLPAEFAGVDSIPLPAGDYCVQIPEYCEYSMGDEPRRCGGRCNPSFCEYAVR